jgi:proline iminopeptidase
MSKRLAAALIFACSGPLVSCAGGPPPTIAPTGALSPGEHRASLRAVDIWYRVAGNRDGRSAPVVFLAGGPGGSSYSFERIAGPFLEPTQLMVYYDQRGTGRSQRPTSGDYAISTLVDDIEALRTHLGVPRIAVIGHSFGAILALEYAARYPAQTAAAVVAGPLWSAPLACREQAERIALLHPDVHRTMMSAGEPGDAEICERVFRAFRGAERERFNETNMFPIPSTLERFNRSEAESGLRNTGELSSAVFRAGLLQYQFAGLERVTAPVLVVGGGRDFAAGPRTQRMLAQRLPRARFLDYPELGHWMFIDDPERFGRDVSQFLRSAQRR